MKVPMIWLRDYLNLGVDAESIAKLLTNAGIEVESIDSIGEFWSEQIVVGKVVSIDEHPNADRLTLPTIDFGSGHQTVVTGAQNINIGDVIPFAMEGATLVNAYSDAKELTVLKPTRLRGVESRGMVCSAAELGISNDHEGILILPEDAPVGSKLIDYMGGQVLDISTKPNRSDCLSVVGVARYLSGLLEQDFRMPKLMDEIDESAELPDLQIRIDDPVVASRYAVGYLWDVKIAESPFWMRRRLEAAGIRPINNIVDITNFVMLEIGQPLHAFDWDKISGGVVGVRRAREGERITTLDAQERELIAADTVIFDGSGPIAIAGVMGGLATEVTRTTTTILLESANFDQTSIRRTSRRLGLTSEASRRFEQRLSPETAVVALRRAVQLAVEIGAGKGVSLWGDSYPQPAEETTLEFSLSEIPRLLGVEFDRNEVMNALERASLNVVAEDESTMTVRVPHWRGDITRDVDLVEEVAVMIGYDKIPSSLPAGSLPESIPFEYDKRLDEIKDLMVSTGFYEIITYATSSEARLNNLLAGGAAPDDLGIEFADRLLPEEIKPLELLNPLRSDENVLITSAISNALETLSSNLRFNQQDVSLFELGRIFLPRMGGLPIERPVLTAVTGQYVSGSSWNSIREVSFFDFKGIVEVVASRMNLPALEFQPLSHPVFKRGQSAAVMVNGKLLGAVGEVDPNVCEAFSVNEKAFLLSLDVSRLLEMSGGPRPYVSVPRLPAVTQDISVVVDNDVPSSDCVRVIKRAGGDLVESIKFIDQYKGQQVAEGKRGLTYSIVYRDNTKTLTDDEVANVHRRIVRALDKRLNAKIRD